MESRLEEADRALLSAIVYADGMEDEESGAQTQANACLARLESGAVTSRKAELKQRIREAERDGRMEDAIALMRELGVLE